MRDATRAVVCYHPDLALVHDVQAGHDDAFRELMRRHRDGRFRFVHRYAANEADAVDLTQETFVRAYLGIRKFQQPATPPSSRPDARAQAHEGLAALEKLINELPFDLRGPLVLTSLEGHSHAEAAELLQVSSKAVELKVYRARKLLLQKLEKRGF